VGTAHQDFKARWARWLPPVAASLPVTTVLVLAVPGAAWANTDDIVAVRDNPRLWIVGIAGTVGASHGPHPRGGPQLP
jgi:hypothetical protein